jgi:hypothetical protein
VSRSNFYDPSNPEHVELKTKMELDEYQARKRQSEFWCESQNHEETIRELRMDLARCKGALDKSEDLQERLQKDLLRWKWLFCFVAILLLLTPLLCSHFS